MFKKKKIELAKIKKILFEKGFIVKKKKNFFYFNDLKSFYYTSLSGLILILIFFAVPLSVDIKKEIDVSKSSFENNSNINFQKV